MRDSRDDLRDIRDDLSDRLRKIAKQRQLLLTQLKALEIQEAAAKALLNAEEAQFRGQELPFGGDEPLQPVTSPTSVFRKFALECLSDGQDWSLSHMTKEAIERGLSSAAEGRSLGRSLHAALLGLRQQGMVERDVAGHWKIVRPRLISHRESQIVA
jgi:hypothetical protein